MFDLGRAMRKKEEFETARLADFAFRRRVRATRMLLRSLDLDEATAARLVATTTEAATLEAVAGQADASLTDVGAEYERCLTLAHAQLVAERGDPAPHRLA